MFDREDAIAYIWDVYKSIHGIRPRWMKFSEMSDDELRERADTLSVELKEHLEAEDAAIEKIEKSFEALIQQVIEMGAKTRENALRWIADDRTTLMAVETMLWELGLIYSRKFDTYAKEIMNAIEG